MKKNVLVTGGTGFTGSHLCLRLASLGCNVKALVRSRHKAGALERAGVKTVTGDLKDKQSLLKAAEGCSVVYHIAAAFRQEGIAEREFAEVNVRGTENMLEASFACGVTRFVHCSTVGVHGHVAHPPADETAPFNPGDIYQETKLEGERLAAEYFRNHPLPGVVFRPVGIYGPGDTRFLKLFRHIKSGRFHMIGNGSALYHLTYIDDLVNGIILCGTHEKAVGNIYILGGNEYMTLNQLVALIADILGVRISRLKIPFWPVYAAGFLCEKVCRPLRIEPPIYRRRVDFFVKDRAFDISKAKRELGYAPRVSPREGLKKTAEWYIENGLL
jgi:nucleoside-diphosphate-sugar epimerase